MEIHDDAEVREELETAIRNFLEAHDLAIGVVTDTLVVVAQQYFDDDGIAHTQVMYASPNCAPHYRRLGLADYAATGLRADIKAATEQDE